MTKHFSSRPRQGFQDFNVVLIMNLRGSSSHTARDETDLRLGKLECLNMRLAETGEQAELLHHRILTLHKEISLKSIISR